MTAPYYRDDLVTLYHGDCLDVLASLPENSVDAIVTDPPYGIGFMGKAWDDLPPGVDFATAALRVLKPGGHMLAFGGSRTWHRLAVAVEDAGFEIRDSIAWLNSQGFPKSMNVAKAISASGEDAERWEGWGTVLKPAFEPIVVARKPLVGTLGANVLAYGTGALNIAASRVRALGRPLRIHTGTGDAKSIFGMAGSEAAGETNLGRWPTNVCLDESQAAALDAQAGPSRPAGNKTPLKRNTTGGYGSFGTGEFGLHPAMQDGGDDRVSRFFPTFRYEAKAPMSERPDVDGIQHVTVKPLNLMRWLVRLVTPPNGLVLEPFAGSGTTVEAALLEGFRCTAIEREADYLPLIKKRISKPLQQAFDFSEVTA